MLDRLGLDFTQAVNALSFLAATVACAVAAWRSPSSQSRTWIWLAVIYGLCVIEIIVGLRGQLYVFVKQNLILHAWYQDRQYTQEAIMAAVVVVFLVGAVFILRRMAAQSWPARVACGITVFVLALFPIETVSLHEFDRVLWSLYYQISGVGWLRVAGAGLIVLAAGWQAGQRNVSHDAYATSRS